MKLSGTIATHCTCNTEEMNDEDMPYTCYGECYDWALEDFAQIVEPLLEKSNYFKVSGIRLWNSTVDGFAKCDNAEDLVQAMSVRGEFILRWEFDDETNALEARLSHHDCPTGCRVTVEAVDEVEYA
jgi:hypothetical protein